MKKTTRNTNNFPDALATDMQFAVLTKTGRIQILVQPTAKQLRKRGKRGWQLFDTVTDRANAGPVLDEIVRKAISEAVIAAGATNRRAKKLKGTKSPTKE